MKVSDAAAAGVSYVSLTTMPNVLMSAGIGDQIITQGLAIGLSFVFTIASKLISRVVGGKLARKKELTKEEVLEETKAEVRKFWEEKGAPFTEEQLNAVALEVAQKITSRKRK